MSQLNPTRKARVRFQIHATMCLNTLAVPLLALIDSGAEENFIDQQVARQAGIKLETLKNPVTTLWMVGCWLK